MCVNGQVFKICVDGQKFVICINGEVMLGRWFRKVVRVGVCKRLVGKK